MSNRLIVSLVITTLAAGCGKDGAKDSSKGVEGAAAPVPPPKLVELDASAAGAAYRGWKLMAPEGATAKEDFGALAVTSGTGFQLEIHSGPLEMPARKKEIESNDVNKLKRYVTDTPDAIVYESDPGIGGPQFHFLAAIKIGGELFSCENTKGPVYTKAQIDVMLQACRSIKK